MSNGYRWEESALFRKCKHIFAVGVKYTYAAYNTVEVYFTVTSEVYLMYTFMVSDQNKRQIRKIGFRICNLRFAICVLQFAFCNLRFAI